MREITKVGDITGEDLAEYCRIPDPDGADMATLGNLLNVAKAFIRNYTGREDLDAFQDFVVVALVLVQDMYDNRTYYVDNANLNRVVESILGMHSVNLL